MVDAMKPLTVVYDRWDDGWWVSRIPSVKGVHSNGRTIEEARRRVREALAIATDEGWDERKAMSVELVDEIHLSPGAKRALHERARALEELQEVARDLERTTEDAIRELLEGMGLGVRDVAAFLGLSHQRVQQLATSGGYDAERRERGVLVRESGAAYRVDRRSAAKRRARRR